MTDTYSGRGRFEWNLEKSRRNFSKHQVTFEEAVTAFRDPFALTIDDSDHSELEERLILVGLSDRQRLLVIVYVERQNILRIISARVANSSEKKEYEEEPSYG